MIFSPMLLMNLHFRYIWPSIPVFHSIC